MRAGCAQDCITWSPGGRILQVEYAMEAATPE